MMVTNTHRLTLDDTSRVRRSANRVLSQLMSDRARIEARLTELGRVDPMKCVTGFSALERAIADTKTIMHDMDRLFDSCQDAMNDAPAA